MDKKRPADSEPDTPSNLPPTKQLRPADEPEPRSSADASGPPDTPAPPSSSNVPRQPDDNHSEPTEEPDPIVFFQRAQLAAKIEEQNRDLLWLRDKVNELQKLVAVLDAAPRAALYHMHAVREDLTITLARLGLTAELDLSQCPIAATLLDAEVVTNESLAEIPAALRELSAQLILAYEAKSFNTNVEPERKQANEDLHRRLREVSDQLERYAERDKTHLVESTTFRDESDDLRSTLSMQRRKIVALELHIREKQEILTAALSAKKEESRVAEGPYGAVKTENIIKDATDPAGNHATQSANGELKEAEAAARKLSEDRLEELKELNERVKRLAVDNETLKADIAGRENNVLPFKAILGTAMYQIMEATLQELYLKEQTSQAERDQQNEDREAERKAWEEHLEETKTNHEKSMADMRRQMEDLRRIADAAKIDKDKVVMTYEARKMEAGNAASVISAAERRANVSEEMRKKATQTITDMKVDAEKLRTQITDLRNELKERRSSGDTKLVIEGLQRDIEDERAKSTGFIQEVESLTTMFSEVESENERLVKLVIEKDQVLSKVMAERLRGRQLLTTVKEENRALTSGRDIDADKIKALTAAVTAAKKASAEATIAMNKSMEESRTLAATLEKRRRIADEATVSVRAATAEKEELKRTLDTQQARVEQLVAEYHEDQFHAKRLSEKLVEAEKRVQKAEEAHRESMENGRASDVDSIRDEIIRELRKKLNCSIVTNRPKEVVLLRCGHLFSRQCTDNLIATRNRKCPICGKPFGNDDVRSVFF